MKILNTERGLTVLETLIVALMATVLLMACLTFFRKNFTFYGKFQTRAQTMFQSRICMETILHRLRTGKARSLVISTSGATTSPNSQVVFDLQTPLPSGATFYTIYLASGTVYAQEGAQQPPKALASNVTALMFTGNANDPAILSVSLRIDAPFDSSNDPTHVSTLIMPDQMVHLAESP
jgi:hypothetical protein